jgi:ribosome-binding factor A
MAGHPERTHHRGRLGEALRDEIVALVEGELADPRIGLVSVNEVRLTPDGKAAHVMVGVTGTDEEARDSMEGLTAARNYIRREVGLRLQLRHTPEIFFLLDRSEQDKARIDELLARVKRRGKKR